MILLEKCIVLSYLELKASENQEIQKSLRQLGLSETDLIYGQGNDCWCR
jgi:hypothetical protein